MIDTKNARLVKSHPWNIPAVFGFIWFSGFREELYKNSTTFSSDSGHLGFLIEKEGQTC
jgi:hypothetical protein